MKKLLAMVLALVMTLSLAVSANAAFEDAKDINATYAEAVDVLAGMKVFQGYDNGKTFKPQGDITRAEVAAIVYRIYTADVKDSYVKNYETYNKFSDMAGAGWAKGYIGYCANAALVKGYPNGTFLPSGKVTGYEVLAMILRAVGYDKNNEFTGADWALHVAQIAEQNKILKNVKGIDLSAPASRELVAELLFQAIQVPTVTYTAAFGYQDVSLTADKKTDKLVKANSSLGYKNFKLVSGDGSDDWGRPTTVWAKDANDNGEYDAKKDTTVYATVVATPDAAFHVETSQCDICEALGEKKEAKIAEVYVNGVNDSKAAKDLIETYKATATKAMVGAQGEQIEFYELKSGDYRLVVIDTYLAYVNEVVTEKTDSKNHTTRDAYMQLDVYKTSSQPTPLYVKGNDYAEEDWVLVNVNDKVDVSIIRTTNKAAEKSDLVEIVAKSESFEGAQTEIWSKAYKHTIDKKDYDDAIKFFKDDAGTTETAKFTWFLDQFGNLIGSAAITSDSYAVLEDIIWIPGKDDHAEATLVYMDGKEETVTVDKIDGLQVTENGTSALNKDKEFYGDFSTALKGSETRQGDTYSDVKFVNGNTNYAYVSTSGSSNDAYKGMALYLVETNKDGSVNLKGADVEYVAKTTINPDSNILVVKETVNGSEKTFKYALNTNTKFIVRDKNDDGKYVYTAKTLKELDKYVDGSAEIYYTVGANQFVTNVYVKNATDAASMSQYIFVPDAANSNVKWIVEDQAFKVKVYVKGEEQYVLASEKIAATLAQNAGKLFAAEWYDDSNDAHMSNGTDKIYGSLKSVDLVNEHTDSEFVKNTTGVDYVTGKKFAGDMLTSYTDYEKTSLENQWNLEKATIIDASGKDVAVEKLSEQDGIWIVSEKTDYSSKALYVYVGTPLSNNTELTASYKTTDADAKDIALTFDAKNDAKVDLADGKLAASVKYTAKDVNAYVESLVDGKWLTETDSNVTVYLKGAGDVAYYIGKYTATEAADDGSVNTGNITVVAEDGVTKETYTITVTKGEALEAPELTAFYGYQVKAYAGKLSDETGTYRTVTFTDGDKIELAKLGATVTNGTVKAYEYWDGAANGGNGAYATITGDLTVSSKVDATWVRLTVTGANGNTYYFVLNTVYQA